MRERPDRNRLGGVARVRVAFALGLVLAAGCDGRTRAPTEDPAGRAAQAADGGAEADGGANEDGGARGIAPPGGERDATADAPASQGETEDRQDGVERPYPLPNPKAVAAAPSPPLRLAAGGKNAVASRFGVVATVEANATRIGIDVLERGGNAVDAAVAVAFALAVTHPQAGGLGGGGFMLVRPEGGPTLAVDYRETSPAEASEETNRKMLAAGARGYASAPVPGVVAGLHLAHQRFGRLPWRDLVAPAVALARDGHRLGARQALVLGWHWKQIGDPTFRAIFGRGKKPLEAGAKLRQPALARTLDAIAAEGPRGFYQGTTASRIEAAMKARGGYVRAPDLESYRAVLREPLRVPYRGFEVHSMPPPSMGGIALATTLIQLEQAKAYEVEPGSAVGIHLFAEAARRSYADRRSVAGDPAFVEPGEVAPLLARLLDPDYHAGRKPPIARDHATSSAQLQPIQPLADAPEESPDTTHFSVVDRDGNAVACTTTLSGAFGSMVVPPETGVIFSNALGAFSTTGINAIEPRKRMASSMTPALVLQDGQVVAIVGSPGGDTIPNTVAQVIRNLVDGHMTVDEAVQGGRVHQQYRPDELRIEKWRPPPPGVVRELERLGHKVVRHVPQGDAHSIVIDRASRTAYGAADPRQGGLALAASSPSDAP